jgi:hypothetical protein
MLGKIHEFDPEKENIVAYLELLQIYFDMNEIAKGKQVPILLTVIGASNYSLLRSLFSPVTLKEKTFEELATVLKTHFEPKVVILAKRFHFYMHSQETDESIDEFLAALRKLATKCDFGTFLDEALRD